MLIEKSRLPLQEIILIGLLPCCLKKLVYRLRGYRMGKRVAIGFGSVICGETVEIGDYTTIGFFTIIRGKSIKIGSYVHIGATTFLDTSYMEIGEGTKINEQVFVGGLQWPDSKFIIGKNCQIMQMTFINPAVSITMGDDSGIGGHSLVFGHASWHSVFDGYTAEFAPIKIGDNVSLTWRSFVMPGVTIGDGSIIGPGSLVTRDVPEKSLAAGFPARIISGPPDFPRQVSVEEKKRLLADIENRMFAYFSASGLECSMEAGMHTVRWRKGKIFTRRNLRRVAILYDNPPVLPKTDGGPDICVSLWAAPDSLRKEFDSRGIVWFDIENKERSVEFNELSEEVSLFIRRFGVRFTRISIK
jgi:acetyltransferase-like isoleucine patch superfamily enzyme